MSTPQTGIFREDSSRYYYLEYSLDNAANQHAIKQALKDAVGAANDRVNVVVAFGRSAWAALNQQTSPNDLKDFESINGVDGYAVPSTQRDILFWVHGEHHDDNFDVVLAIQSAMKAVAQIQLDLSGFRYHDSRDLTGFIDGSANPKGDERKLAALIPEGQDGAGGSYVLTQQWVHNLDKFNQQAIDQQEKIIGRTKTDSIELEGDNMPPDSHVSRTDVKIDGKAMKIYRRSAPFGAAEECGLHFIAFACEIERFTVQLERMFGVSGDNLHDRIIEFSVPKTSSYWFAPSSVDLNKALH